MLKCVAVIAQYNISSITAETFVLPTSFTGFTSLDISVRSLFSLVLWVYGSAPHPFKGFENLLPTQSSPISALHTVVTLQQHKMHAFKS